MPPKGAKNEPKRAPKHVQEHPSSVHAKSRFLKVDGAAWEFKFGTKRVQDKKYNYLEDDSERKHDNNTKIWQDEAPKKKCLSEEFFFWSFSVGWMWGRR